MLPSPLPRLVPALVAAGAMLVAAGCARARTTYVPVPNSSPYEISVDTARIERVDGDLLLWIRSDWRDTPGMGRVGPARATGQEVRVRLDCAQRRYQQHSSRLVTAYRSPPRRDSVVRWEGADRTREPVMGAGGPSPWYDASGAWFDVDAVCTRWGGTT